MLMTHTPEKAHMQHLSAWLRDDRDGDVLARPASPQGAISNISPAIYRRGRGSVAKYNRIILFSQFYFYMSQCVSGLLPSILRTLCNK